MKSVAEAQIWCQQQLKNSESPAVDSRALLCFVLKKNRTYLMTWPERLLSGEQWHQLQGLVAKRQLGHPIAHLTGEREFWSLPLQVNDSTLIPRPDTETLVETALALQLPNNARVLDLGTGTGAIALALKSERPHWQVTALDKSPAATNLARENAERLGLSVDIRESDWFGTLNPSAAFDLIVSNPPYIDEQDPHLQQGDVRFEPPTALIAANQGLADIEHIIVQARTYLREQGWLLLEHGWRQSPAVVELLAEKGYKHINRWKDYGNVERVTGGQKAS